MGAIPEVDPDEPVETKPFKFVTAAQDRRLPIDWEIIRLTFSDAITGYDARFPQMNQTKHCWQNYVDYYKCVTAKGEDFRPCRQFYHAFRALCPKAWTDRWDGQREAGNFPAHLDR
ncbi:cytochrome c oxidase subunit 6B [Penicillium hispanicum]|uniref:cytochrome c oxidase subunit 6B n=1 Tax=Penicillium hispanicum TaxID=1080232 RepID=UPI00254227EE|nr:cytochrome c oxidase subunit 6B [Penicillium hispanicum]KAJ5594892.1 cytochrome c oxidase subunit 6B [Penicillium hispanicum]